MMVNFIILNEFKILLPDQCKQGIDSMSHYAVRGRRASEGAQLVLSNLFFHQDHWNDGKRGANEC